jgi:hypothetical protein
VSTKDGEIAVDAAVAKLPSPNAALAYGDVA